MRIEIIITPDDPLCERCFGCLKACDGVSDSIKNMGFSVLVSLCKTENDLIEVKDRVLDIFVLAKKYLVVSHRNNSWLSKCFEKNGVVFIDSDREILRFGSDKILAKSTLRTLGVRTEEYFTVLPGQYKCDNNLSIDYSIYIEPIESSSGNGVDDDSVVNKVNALCEVYQCSFLAEECLDGKEFTVAIHSRKNRAGLEYDGVVKIILEECLHAADLDTGLPLIVPSVVAGSPTFTQYV